jgi:hypothetical protein
MLILNPLIMKKITYYFSFMLLFLAFFSCDEQSEFDSLESTNFKKTITKQFETILSEDNVDYCGEPVTCTLIAGQNLDAGEVTIQNNKTHLYVKVYSKAGFQNVRENIKMYIGLPEDLPSKRPPAGHFPYKVTESGDTYIFEIPLSTLDGWDDEGDCAQDFAIIVHADVLTKVGDAGSGETAFGGCVEGSGKAWWYYMEYKTSCCEEMECVDAFARKDNDQHAFCILDNEGNTMAWSSQLDYNLFEGDRGASHKIRLWVNVDQCDPWADEERINVGFATVTTFSEGIGDGMKLYANVKYWISDQYKDQYKILNVSAFFGLYSNSFDINGKPIMPDEDEFYHQEVNDLSEYTLKRINWPGTNGNLVWDTYFISKIKVCKIN